MNVIRRLGAVLVLAVVVVGAPIALWVFGRDLLPDHVPTWPEVQAFFTQQDTGALFLGALVLIGVAAWLVFTVSVLVEAAAMLTGRRGQWHLPGLQVPQRAASVLLSLAFTSAIVVGTALPAAASAPVGAGLPAAVAHYQPAGTPAATPAFPARAPALEPVPGESTNTPGHAQPARPQSTAPVAAAAGPGPVWTVGRYDTLWRIAERSLGVGSRFPEIVTLNQGVTQPDGGVLVDADTPLNAGWQLHLPAGATAPTTGATRPAPAPPSPTRPAAQPTPTPQPPRSHVVAAGETLSGIALQVYGDAALYPVIANANHLPDPDKIDAGQTLVIPPKPAQPPGSHVVAAGETLSGIALQVYGDAALYPVIANANHLPDPDRIDAGQTLTIPPAPSGKIAKKSPSTAGKHSQPDAGTKAAPNGPGPTPEPGSKTPQHTPATTDPTHPSEHSTAPTEHSPGADTTGQTQTLPTTAGVPSEQPHPTAPAAAPPNPAATAPEPPSTAAATPPAPGTQTVAAPEPPSTAAATPPAPGTQTVAAPDTPQAGHSADQAAPSPTASTASWPLIAGGGGALLLAGVSFQALRRRRRRQDRFRRPGRAIARTSRRLRRMEQALLTAGPSAAEQATRLDHALRSLSAAVRAGAMDQLPRVAAVRIGPDGIELHLALAAPDAPEPWQVGPDALRWLLPTSAEVSYDDDTEREFTLAPYPALVSIGHTPAGEQYLLDLEQLGALELSGPPGRCRDLLRFMAAELAHNTWSEMLSVTACGLGDELAELNPGRLAVTNDPATTAATMRRHLADVLIDQQAGTTVLDGRARGGDREVWPPQVLLLGTDPGGGDDANVTELLGLVQAEPERVAAAVVLLAGPDQARPGWQARLDDDGQLSIPEIGVTVTAEQLPAHEAQQLAELLAEATNVQDEPTPPAGGDRQWENLSDAAGAPRGDVAAPARPVLHLASTDDSTPERVLSLDIDTYTERAATTAHDVQSLAPVIPDEHRDAVRASLDRLDADLADWYDPTNTRPKIALLGPVQVTAAGQLPEDKPRLAWHTEVVAYLATRPRGATAEQYGTALWPDDPDIVGKSKVRQSVYVVRRWLGVNPSTSRDYLPTNPGVAGVVYRIEDALVDAELFRQLRLRGVSRGADGINDLQAALNLVTGAPFDQRRPTGYGWLAEEALDHHYTATIVDVAHTVATHHLTEGDPEAAAQAAEVALLAGSCEDTPLLDLAAACEARGMNAEVDTYVRRILHNHDVDEEVDLPPRTFEVLHRRGWLRDAS